MITELLWVALGFVLIYAYLWLLNNIRHSIGQIRKAQEESTEDSDNETSTSYVGSIVSSIVGIILIVAVSIPVTNTVLETANLTGTVLEGTTTQIISFIPVFLAVAGVVLFAGLFMSAGSDHVGEEESTDKPKRRKKKPKYFEDGSDYDNEESENKDISSLLGGRK